MRFVLGAVVVAAMVSTSLLAGCGERQQTVSHRKADGNAWETTQRGFRAPGWDGADEKSWDLQLKNRAQGQNEYSRAPAQQRL